MLDAIARTLTTSRENKFILKVQGFMAYLFLVVS